MGILSRIFGASTKKKSETELFTEALALFQSVQRWIEAHPAEVAAAWSDDDAWFTGFAAKRHERISGASTAREEIGYEAAALEEAREALGTKNGDASHDAPLYARAVAILILSFCVSAGTYKRLSGPYSTLANALAYFARKSRATLPVELSRTIERIGQNLIDANLRHIGQPILTALGR